MTTKNSNNDSHEVIYTRTGGDPIAPDSIEKSKRTGLKFFAVVFGGSALGAWYLGLGGLAMAALAVGAVASIGLILSARKAQSAGETRAITGGTAEAVDDAQSIRKAIEQAALPEAISSDLISSLDELVEKANSLANSRVETEAALSRIPVADTERKLQQSIDNSDSDSANIHMKTLKQAEELESQVAKIDAALGKVKSGMLALSSAVRTASLPTPVDTDVDISEIELQSRALAKTKDSLSEDSGNSVEKESDEDHLAAAAAMLANRKGR